MAVFKMKWRRKILLPCLMFFITENYVITCHFNTSKKYVAATPYAISQALFQSRSKVSQVLAALFLLGSSRFLSCLFARGPRQSCGHYF